LQLAPLNNDLVTHNHDSSGETCQNPITQTAAEYDALPGD